MKITQTPEPIDDPKNRKVYVGLKNIEKEKIKGWLRRIKITSLLTAIGGALTLVVTIDTLFVMQRQFRDSTIIQDSRHFESRISEIMNRVTMDITTSLLYHGRYFLRDCVSNSGISDDSRVVYTQDLCRMVAIEVLYGGADQQNSDSGPPLLENLLGLSLELSQASLCIERNECHAIITIASLCPSFETYFDLFTYLDGEFLRHVRENDSVALAAISTGTLTNNLLEAREYCRQIEAGEIERMSEHGILSFFL